MPAISTVHAMAEDQEGCRIANMVRPQGTTAHCSLGASAPWCARLGKVSGLIGYKRGEAAATGGYAKFDPAYLGKARKALDAWLADLA